MSLREIKKICPNIIILPSDYETYSLYSKRMYEIVRRYTEEIEEYSIDECFADLTGMRRPNRMSYEQMTKQIKDELDTELGMTFSVGLSVNKVTAKIGSKWKKPSGLTIITSHDLNTYLAKYAIEKIWGIGPQTSAYLRKFNITTALDFAKRDIEWVAKYLSKPFQEIHRELNGHFVYPLIIGEKHDYSSISKTKTFTPPSKDKAFVFSQLSKNIENACIKLRRHNLYTKRFAFFLKTQDFHYQGLEFKLLEAVSVPQEIVGAIREQFNKIFSLQKEYRATGITLMDLDHCSTTTIDMFGQSLNMEKMGIIYKAIDSVSARFGKHTVFLGSSFKAMTSKAHRGDRGEASERRAHLLKGENSRKRLGIPFLGRVT
jgi:DNA polymerase-4/DNA polymerase V